MTNDEEILAVARAGFRDEAAELLVQFEQALLAIEQQPDDAEAMNCAFRAAHTMKGTAGLFGCDALVAFTHDVESLLDDLRSNVASLQPDTMSVLLLARDQLEELLQELDAPEPSPAVAQRSVELGVQLRALRGAHAATSDKAAPVAAAASTAGDRKRSWRIALKMGADALRNGLDPLSFIRYLGTLGSVVKIDTLAVGQPDLAELDPEGCHLSFDIELLSGRSREDIEQTFEFLADDCQLAVTAMDGVEDAAAGASRPDSAEIESATALALTADVITQAASDLAMPVTALAPLERRAAGNDRRQQGKDRRGNEEARFIRVRADKLDALVDMIGELVIASSGAQMVAQQEHSARFVEAAARIHDLVQSARDGALGLRMVPIGESFSRFQRVVRDVSKQMGKDVELQITGGDTEMDKSMVETISDPLMHLVRNSLDHGIETLEERLATGKPTPGRLALHAYHESGSIVIEVSDDGRGLNRDRILAKAVEQGLVPPDAQLDDEAVYQLIFRPGFSTAQQITNLSGRGVGMDVVKSNVEALRGQIRIASQLGQGTTIQIRLPLTLAIIDGFLTSVAGVSYVLPLEIVGECIEMPAECRLQDNNDGVSCFDLRGEVVPFIDLRKLFRHPGEPPARRSLIVVHTSTGLLGLLVDRLHGEYQTVIKPLATIFHQLQGIAGSTILGSGEVALILDVAALEARVYELQQRGGQNAWRAAVAPSATLTTTHP